MQYPDERDQSAFYHRASGSRLAAALLGGNPPSDGDRFCDAWYRPDPPELISMTCRTREEFEQRFRVARRQWGPVSLEEVEPFSRVPRFVLEAALGKGKPAE